MGATGWSVEPNLHYAVLRRRDDGEYEPVDPRNHVLDYRWRREQGPRLERRAAGSVAAAGDPAEITGAYTLAATGRTD